MRIPNLFTATDESQRLYSLLLCRFSLHDRFDDMVEVSRKIRRHARQSVGIEAALFTYTFENEALWYLGQHNVAWTQQLRFETDAYGHPLDLSSDDHNESDRYHILNQRSRLHYACGRYRDAAKCREFSLGLAIPRSQSEYLLYEITNLEHGKEPTHPATITLNHIYERLGKRLSDWSEWDAFARGFKPTTYRKSKVTPDALADDDSLLDVILQFLANQNRKNARRRPERKMLIESRWESELLKWFPFIQSIPCPKLES